MVFRRQPSVLYAFVLIAVFLLATASCSEAGQTLEVDLTQGTITNLDTSQVFQAGPYPPFLMGIIEAGGLIPYTRRKLGVDAR